jgi:hypothetical protein
MSSGGPEFTGHTALVHVHRCLRPAPYGPRYNPVEAAVEAGAELREHFSVQKLLTDGERVMGIRGHAVGVLDADGGR